MHDYIESMRMRQAKSQSRTRSRLASKSRNVQPLQQSGRDAYTYSVTKIFDSFEHQYKSSDVGFGVDLSDKQKMTALLNEHFDKIMVKSSNTAVIKRPFERDSSFKPFLVSREPSKIEIQRQKEKEKRLELLRQEVDEKMKVQLEE